MGNLLMQIVDKLNIPYGPDDEVWVRYIAGPRFERALLLTAAGALTIRIVLIAFGIK